jgi:hypothetical protein
LALALTVPGLLIRFLAGGGFVGTPFRRAGVAVAVAGLALPVVQPLTWLGEVLRQAPGV